VTSARKKEINDGASTSAWPADKVERRSVVSLVRYARNPRTHTPRQVDQIAASIREWGWTVPVLVDEQGGLIAGLRGLQAIQRDPSGDRPPPGTMTWTCG
jgi:ParB-like nuclease family protein